MNITSLHILTKDLVATTRFYKDHLQWNISGMSENEITFRLPQGSITFHQDTVLQPLYHIAFNIPCNQVRQASEWLKEKAEIIPVEGKEIIADFSNWNAEAVYFFDHNHNIIELIGRRDLQNESDVPFSGQSVLSISEIGIVTSDVISSCNDFKTRFDLDYFDKQPASEKFSAMGNDQGLFIIVKNNRPWYPTSIASSTYWLKVEFMEKGKMYCYEHFA